MKRTIVVAITGASGVTYSLRLLEVLLASGCNVHLTISDAARAVLEQELDLHVDLDNFSPAMLMLDTGEGLRDLKLQMMRSTAGISGDSSNVLGMGGGELGRLHYHHYRDRLAPIASGSFPTDGMVVCPCSGASLSAIVHGAADNLVHRAAEVHMKERRKLILVPRETPLSLPQIENMRLAALAGAVILPASPGFYHGVKLLGDLADFIVSRICDQLGIANTLIQRWGESSEGSGIGDTGSGIASRGARIGGQGSGIGNAGAGAGDQGSGVEG
jgi:flavin prenyltransferase